MEITLEHLKFPIGRFTLPISVDTPEINAAIEKISLFPSQLRDLINGLNEDALDTPYRPDGWTVRQVVHHCADSHMNAFIRFKLTLTEEDPVIKPYHEDLWAKQWDYKMAPTVSITLIESLHTRWVVLMRSMKDADWDRSFIHPEYNRIQKLRQTAMLYAWHGEHHLGHIKNAIKSIR